MSGLRAVRACGGLTIRRLIAVGARDAINALHDLGHGTAGRGDGLADDCRGWRG
jgi:hypothetical protein